MQGLLLAAMMVFGGWKYTPPKGYETQASDDHIVFTKVTDPTFCMIALFQARETADTAAKESLVEWQNVIEKNFKVGSVKRGATTQTKNGISVTPAIAQITDADGNAFSAIHYVITPAGMISSVLLTSNTAAALDKCKPVATALIDSMVIDAASAVSVDPEARVQTPVGRWANSYAETQIAPPGKPGPGSARREYTFAPDGTYMFRSETWGGTSKAEQFLLVDESGKYSIVGNQLTLAPAKSTSILNDQGVAKKPVKRALEKVTYAWSKQYFDGNHEWQLVLTPAKKTARDGEFAANEKFATSYVYSDHYKPEWKFPSPSQ